ncbi:MAG TPA: HlyD family efflux transporter periplasmic adaptor subunit [Chitinophagales bacterium]|nr:HlyD family efflux transporter periplasmic adaptor subunit [Chitinophagales bacterium]HRG26277.1 HlyD family efflux transporter periplasmic adaptor subunit [Chitinophagales bacterium]HRG84266.1 HlyD family efflux transporter periplasmic adaptor subunit [Chitinophagales bacterium]HRH53730.1 HlyD family efflux transporter periplasmic adaptor subunit [Chitinophagales bacterium]
MKKTLIILSATILLASCAGEENAFDATGTFEAKEIIVSTGVGGKIIQLKAEEGDSLSANAIVGTIDTTQLYLKKLQLQAQIKAVLSKQPDINSQIAGLQEQIKTANTEKIRIDNLVAAGVGTQKQADDIRSQITVLQKQLDAQQTALQITSQSIYQEVAPLTLQIAQVDDQLVQSAILNPVKGTVLTLYAEQGEFTTPGKAIYKIADLSTMTLRAYITGAQLAQIKLGQQVTVKIDNGEKNYSELPGTIYWISEKAEFTPKTIQTKEERANLVYAIKVKVPNNGQIKIGMYGELILNK